jgi:hypothetical protein
MQKQNRIATYCTSFKSAAWTVKYEALWMNKHLLAVLIILLPAGLHVALPVAAFSCNVQIKNVNYPDTLNPSQSLTITGTVTVACMQAGSPISGRIDLVESTSHKSVTSSSFSIGYISGAQSNQSFLITINTVVPSVATLWQLEIVVTLWYGSTPFTGASYPLVIQVGQTEPVQPTMQIQVLQNGGFEAGLSNWQTVGREGQGSVAISSNIVHSGSGAVMLTLLPPLPGTSQLVSIVQGVSQTVSVAGLRDLTVLAWVHTQIDTTLAYPRLLVTVGGLTVDYVGGNCPGWCQMAANVGQDIRVQYGVGPWSSAFRSSHTISVTTAVELVGQLPYEDNQFVFWDDIQAFALVPANMTVITSSTQSIVTTQLSTTGASSSTESSPTTTIQTAIQTTTAPFIMSPEELYGSLVVVLAAGLVAETFVLLRQRAHKNKTPEKEQLS